MVTNETEGLVFGECAMMKSPREMSGSELLAEFCHWLPYMRQVDRARDQRLPVLGLVSVNGGLYRGSRVDSPRGYYELPVEGSGPIMVRVPHPTTDALWSALRAEVDRRFGPELQKGEVDE